ncbi:MAG: chemotaxis protein CheB [Balneolaceae bacterium]|nr:chemotaxis protein CheB [Balneolaceae bacterium]
MKKILVVDGDVLARQAFAKVLQERTDHQIFVQADVEALVETVLKTDPDLLLLGIDPEKVEEIAMLSVISHRFPGLPLVVGAERTREGATIGIAALKLGAFDIVTKPENYNSILFAERHLVKRLVPIVQSALKIQENKKNDFGGTYANRSRKLNIHSPLEMVVVGGCTGGPAALLSIIKRLPKTLSVPIVIVQHLPRFFTTALATKLNEITELPVKEASHGMTLKPGRVSIIPGGFHGEVHRDGSKTRLKLHKGPRENKARPSIDLLFRSAARLYGSGVLGIILSGCGVDGLAGAGAVKHAGGQVIVQDYRSALVPDLPLSVIRKGYQKLISPVDQIPEHISNWDISGTSSKPAVERNSARLKGPKLIRKPLFSSAF